MANQFSVIAKNGMVASSQPLATLAGVQILMNGGNAIDAAIATAAVLGVVEPSSIGIGGDAFCLFYSVRENAIKALDASGRSPYAASFEFCRKSGFKEMPQRGIHSVTVPGAVHGWATLLNAYGKKTLGDVLQSAIRYAEEGFPVAELTAHSWHESESNLKADEGASINYLVNGRTPRAGEIFKNPHMGKTLRRIADGGTEVFYQGEIAGKIVRCSERLGGLFSIKDFADHRSDWVEPITINYRDYDVYEMPPATQGFVAIEMLKILEGFDLKSMGRGSPELWHTMVEAKKLAYEDRARYIADPAFAKVPVEGLLAKDYARARARLIDPARAAARYEAGQPALNRGDTTYIAVADGDGNMVSLIQSNYFGFGSGYVVDGFAIQNRGSAFDLEPGRPNSLLPGKRPFHTIIPAFAMRDGKPWLAFGLMGGDMQAQGHAQVIVNLVDFGMNLQEAGDAARFYHTDSSEPNGTVMARGGVLHLEHGVSEEVRRELVKRGHRVADAVGLYGGYEAVARDPVTGVLSGATESRKDGCAMGY